MRQNIYASSPNVMPTARAVRTMLPLGLTKRDFADGLIEGN